MSRSMLLSLVVLFVASTFAVAADPPKKQVKAKPPASKPVAPVTIVAVSPGAIAKALDQPTQMEFVDTPLYDVVNHLTDVHKIPIVLDRKGLGDIGVQLDQPVSAVIKGVTLRSALNHVLHELDLTWTVRDEALLITAPEQADAMLETRVYDVADLVAARDEQQRPYNDFGQLIEAITSTIQPTRWDTVGGPGSIAQVEAAGITALVVSHTYQMHEAVEKLLADLRKAERPGVENAPPVRKRPKLDPGPVDFCPLTGPDRPQPPKSEPQAPAKPAKRT